MGERRIRLRFVGPNADRKWDGDRLLRIGRSPDLEIVLNDTSVSRRHAEIVATDHGWVVRDLGSRNGTFLNGSRVGRLERRLQERDLVQCGNLVLSVELLVEAPLQYAETPHGSLQVQAMTRQSLEQAADLLVQDATRRTRPGEQLLSLLRAGQAVDQVDSLDDFLRQSLRDTVTAVRARRGAIILFDRTTRRLRLSAAYSTRPDLAGTTQCFSQTLAGRCFQGSQSLLCIDIYDDPELRRATSVQETSMTSVICALLRSPRLNLGVLHLDRGPSDDPFTRDELHLADALAANLSTALEGAQRLQERQRHVFIQTVLAFSQVIEMRDEYTGGHTQRVTDLALLLADEMKLSETDRYHLRVGAPLHDIGKIGIDDAILRKRERLTPAEFEHMKTHAARGADILGMLPGLEDVIPIVRNHHERWDGTGYPDRLRADRIPRLARLVTVADTFDAMTTDRPYRASRSPAQAFGEIRDGAGSQFDPECAEAFLRVRARVEQLLREYESLPNTQRPDQIPGLSGFATATACV
jgi:putative nucleotidyltransferase with HDIG domain